MIVKLIRNSEATCIVERDGLEIAEEVWASMAFCMFGEIPKVGESREYSVITNDV